MGRVRVDGLPYHLSRDRLAIARGAPCLGEHNDFVYGELLGLSEREIDGAARRGRHLIATTAPGR